MRRRTLLASLTPVVAALAAACTPSLATFNRFTPRDQAGRKVRAGERYGANARQSLDVYAPAAGGTGLPVIVFLYGGSWRSGAKEDYAFVGEALAARGFVTIIPDYRLVPEVRFPTFLEDCAAAVAWARAHAGEHGGDGARIVLVGHSAGAYNTMMLALDPRYLRDAGAPIRGAAGLSGPYDFLPFDVDSTRDAFGQTEDPRTTQPVSFARADAPPLLLLWGEDDTTVGPRNLQGLERAMRAAGGRVETKTYPRVGHVEIMLALSRPFRARAPVLDDVIAFARRVSA